MSESKQYIYKNSIRWTGGKKGMFSADRKQELEVSTPPEFNGPAGYWSPEDLFVASVNSCIMTTFIYFAERKGISFKSYSSSAEGILKMKGGGLKFTKVIVRPKIEVEHEELGQKFLSLIRLSEEYCLISNSIEAEVELEPEIVTGPN
jgi:peroxiredoxin-like protein